MKSKTLMLTCMLLVIFSCNNSSNKNNQSVESTEKSVKEWQQKFYNLAKSLQIAELIKYYAEDVIYIDNEYLYTYDEISQIPEDITEFNIEPDSSKIVVIDPNHAILIDFGYGYQYHASGNKFRFRYNSVQLLEKVNNDWKIKIEHDVNNYFPLLFSDKIAKEQRTGTLSQNRRFKQSVDNFWFYNIKDLEFIKSKGISLDEYAQNLGDVYAKSWDAEIGFDEFCKNVIRNSQLFSTEVEIMEKTDRTLTIRYYKDYKDIPLKNLSDKEILKFWETVNSRIANKMNTSLTLRNDGDYFIQTCTKK